ncbi:MAG: Phosphorylated carbohydrates phosphatase [Chlamydiia bacterium]|nr:Phosphorylated carbohydrates phosphatase [Chlamydiia bacterium]
MTKQSVEDLINNYNTFLFDFDGLLVNTEELHFEAYRRMVEDRGFTLNWTFPEYVSHAHVSTETLRDAIYNHLPQLKSLEPNWHTLRDQKQRHYELLLQKEPVPLLDGVEEFLALLTQAGKETAVVTNSPLNHILHIKHHHPILSQISTWITREDYQNAKPAADPYCAALEKFKKLPSDAIGFEDAIKGLCSLLAAQITPMWIHQGHYSPQVLNQFDHVQQHTTLKDLLTPAPK